MLKIHEMEHRVNKKMKGRVGDSIAIVGNEFSLDTTFFFIDEFQVLDIADAMILKRLFESFIETRMIVVFTSNRPPEDLYLNGLQRHLFEPFIKRLNEKADIVNLNSIDYRLLHSMGMNSYYSPFSTETTQAVEDIWNSLTGSAKGTFANVEVAQGRFLPVSRQAKGVAEMTFSELCD
jgi:cell division protein ZapE